MFKIKLKQFLLSLKKPLNLLGILLAVVFIFAYGLGLGFLMIHAGDQELKDFPIEWVKKIVVGLAAFMTIGRMFKPNYVPMRQTLQKYQPITMMQRYVYSLVSDFQNVYFVMWLVFLTGMLILSGQEGIVLSISVLLVLACSHLVRRTIQYFIDFRQKRQSVIYVVTVFALAGGMLFLIETNWFLLAVFGFTTALVVLGFYLEKNILEKKLREENVKNRPMGLKMLLNNKNVRTPLIVGFVSKIVILSIDLFLFKYEGEHLFDGQGFYWLFISPAIIFTYVFHNVWGFWRSAWLNLEMRSGNIGAMIKFIWRMIKYPVLLDVIITFSMVFFVHKDYVFIFTFYFSTLFILLATAFLWSSMFPKWINHAMPKKGSTSYWSIFFVFAAVIGLSFMSKGGLFYLLLPLFLLVAVAGFIISKVFYPEKKYELFAKLFRSE